MTRWGLTSGKSVEQTEKTPKTVSAELWNKLHLQIIFTAGIQPGRGWSLEKDFITRTVLGGKAPSGNAAAGVRG